MNRCKVAVFTFCVLLCTPCEAVRIYRFVNYPLIQDGHTLDGTITVTDDAPLDSFLETDEILDWEWEVRDELEVTIAIGQMHPTFPHSDSFTEVVGIEVDAQGVYLPHELGHGLELESNTNLDSRGFNIRRLAWFNGQPDAPSRYVFNGIKEGDIAFRAWGADLPAHADRWLIATSVPEPSTATLGTLVLFVLSQVIRRRFTSRRSGCSSIVLRGKATMNRTQVKLES